MKFFYGASMLMISSISGALTIEAALANECARPSIMSRSVWQAKPAKQRLMKVHTPDSVVIHHTAVRQRRNSSLRRKMVNLQSFSQRPGLVGTRKKPSWGDVPYHFYIDATGRVAEGRSLKYAGDTNTRYNLTGKIQIVLEGNFAVEKPSPKQIANLKRLVCWLSKTYSIPAKRIKGHMQHASTGCPGAALQKQLPAIVKWVSSKTGSS